MIKRPLYVDKILPYIDMPFVKILTGIRRCGKSTIMGMIADELLARGIPGGNIVRMNYARIEYRGNPDPMPVFEEIKSKLAAKGRTYLFLDEIQEIEDWERVVNTLFEGGEFDVDIFVTGSDSRMMSSEISTYLTGRYVSFQVYPLSFAEFLDFKRHYAEVKAPKEEFENYLIFGGFPALHLREMTQDEAYTVVEEIYNTTIFADIVRRSQIRKVDQLERIVKFAFDNVGKTFSANSIADYMKSQRRAINVETVYTYLSKLESAYILGRCSRYDLRGKEILKTQEKFYLADPALKYSVLGFDPTSVSAMLENLVWLELRRRGYDVYIGKDGEREIDFLAQKQNDKLYIQVSREINSPKTEAREYDRLLAIGDNYPKYVLRTDAFAQGNHEGIKTMHVAEFLLSDEF